MNCPNCGTKMECEQSGLAVPKTLAELATAPTNPIKMVPAAHYYCDGCDSEWVWSMCNKIKCIDGGNVPAHFMATNQDEQPS